MSWCKHAFKNCLIQFLLEHLIVFLIINKIWNTFWQTFSHLGSVGLTNRQVGNNLLKYDRHYNSQQKICAW